MIALLLAIAVGSLFASGTYMIMRRGQIKLILGLGLLSHGVNLLLFGSGILTVGRPPIFLDKKKYADVLAAATPADPLPQALILTAIVISFGITAFVIVLVNRRHTIAATDVVHGEFVPLLREGDPFYFSEEGKSEDLASEDAENGEKSSASYDWLAFELDEVYDREEMPADWIPRPSSEIDESEAMERTDE